jgi:hypothetical protein
MRSVAWVIDAQTMAPVAGATVSNSDGPEVGITSDSGVFLLPLSQPVQPDASLLLNIRKEGYLPATVYVIPQYLVYCRLVPKK